MTKAIISPIVVLDSLDDATGSMQVPVNGFEPLTLQIVADWIVSQWKLESIEAVLDCMKTSFIVKVESPHQIPFKQITN